ncbi:protein-glutamate O-methyltransferase CheR [Melioribacteraceae bacterium 4301-Me]|uniref:CheR family methyltransferase n=1 Tax=Pyranulibacter aquaticus TaxID=3163344 RepID=UPI00359B1119
MFQQNAIQSDSLRTILPQKINLSDRTFDQWRKFIFNSTGIYFQDNKKYLLESRLLRRINYLGLNSFEEYYDYLNNSLNYSKEITHLYEAITINETFFFRNQPQFDSLVSSIIPELVEYKSSLGDKKIRIWSAASSTGEEAYTIAMVILELVKPKFPHFTFEIIGTDINKAVIEAAKKGVYREYSLHQTSPYYIKKYFNKEENFFELKQEVKSMVSFKVLNLYDTLAVKQMNNFDVIFCANVLIYFNNESKARVVSSLYDSLNKNGYLFIGYSETLHGISKAFKLVNFPKTIGYKKE